MFNKKEFENVNNLRFMVNVLKFQTKLINFSSCCSNFKNYDLLKILLFEILGQIHLQPKIDLAVGCFRTPETTRKGSIGQKDFLICKV